MRIGARAGPWQYVRVGSGALEDVVLPREAECLAAVRPSNEASRCRPRARRSPPGGDGAVWGAGTRAAINGGQGRDKPALLADRCEPRPRSPCRAGISSFRRARSPSPCPLSCSHSPGTTMRSRPRASSTALSAPPKTLWSVTATAPSPIASAASSRPRPGRRSRLDHDVWCVEVADDPGRGRRAGRSPRCGSPAAGRPGGDRAGPARGRLRIEAVAVQAHATRSGRLEASCSPPPCGHELARLVEQGARSLWTGACGHERDRAGGGAARTASRLARSAAGARLPAVQRVEGAPNACRATSRSPGTSSATIPPLPLPGRTEERTIDAPEYYRVVAGGNDRRRRRPP